MWEPKLPQRPEKDQPGSALLHFPRLGWARVTPQRTQTGDMLVLPGFCCPLVATMPTAAPDGTFVNMFMPTAVATAVVVAVM